MNDLRYAFRTLRNSPAFTIVVTLLLALGIGSSCVIFSALDAIMLRRLPVRQPGQLYRVVTNLPQLGKRSYIPLTVYKAIQQRATTVADVFGFEEAFEAITEPGPAEQIRVHHVTPNYFSALGVSAAIGRVLAPDDIDAAVLSYGFFEQRFQGDPAALGRTIVLHGHRFTVIGVMPRAFNGTSLDTAPPVRVPLAASVDGSTPIDLSVRLRPGVAIAQASGEINSIWRPIESQQKFANPAELDKGIELEPLEHGTSRLRDRFSDGLLFLSGAVGLLLLIVCANVAGLMLARGASRQREISVRLALGATRARLIRQMLTESALLAAAGGVGGLLVTVLAMPLLERALPPMRDFSSETVPLALHFAPDLRVLAISIFLSVATALLFGLAPAMQAASTPLSNRSTTSWKGRQALMIFEVALCTVLLAGAGLLVRTFEQLRHLDTGFDSDHVVTFTVNPSLIGYTAQQSAAASKAWIEKVRALPGVTSVASATLGVMRGSGMKTTIGVTGEPITAADFMNASLNRVSPEYFSTMGMRLLDGRGFVDSDRAAQEHPKVIVNQTFARRFFHGASALGRTAGNGPDASKHYEIIGVVSDAKYRSLREPVPATLYTLLGDNDSDRFILHVRTANAPQTTIGPTREALRSVDPQIPLIEIHTLADEVSASLSSERLTASLAAIFGGIAALLTAVGLYGLLAHTVSQRTREIGIRMALGARPSNISGVIGGQALRIVAAGLGAGIAVMYLLATAIGSLLYGIPPRDGVTILLTVVYIASMAAFAILIPLTRALRIDPAIALRQDT